MKTIVFLIVLTLLGTYLQAQQVPLPRPISTVIQFPIESDQWPNSPLITSIPVSPMSTMVIVPLPVPPVFENPSVQASAVELPLFDIDTNWTNSHAGLVANGVKYYDSTKTQNGVTVLDLMSRSLIIDMQGRVLKKMPVGFPDLQADGSLVGAMERGANLIKADADLDVMWKIHSDPHHEITVAENGDIYLLSKEDRMFMGINTKFDLIKKYSAEGKLVYKWRLYDHLKEFMDIISKSAYLSNLKTPYDSAKGIEAFIAQDPSYFFLPSFQTDTVNRRCDYEFSHFNSIQVLPANELSKRIPAFKEGNILLSFNPYSCYGVLNTTNDQIEWVGYLPERTTLHTPLLTSTGTILVYQNSTEKNSWTNGLDKPCLDRLLKKNPRQNPAAEPSDRNWLSVSEYDPLTNDLVWEYTASPKESLRAGGLGNAQRLTNGNTLVCAATEYGGKIFEVTPEKQIVWYYISPEIDKEHNYPLGFYRAKRVNYEIAKKVIPGFKP